MPQGFIIDGYKVAYHDGAAEFFRFGVKIEISSEEFTYDWSYRTYKKLLILARRRAMPADTSDLADPLKNE